MSPLEVRALIAEVLGIDTDRVRGDLAFGELPEWDSLHHVNLILALEERLGTEVGADQMVELTTVTLIEEFAGAHGSVGSTLDSLGD
jgi:acyl carrier protein